MEARNKKLNIFLDLDHTIICSEEYGVSKLKEVSTYDYDFINPYVTAARPCLQLFLDEIFENYNVSIWTAASKNYASFIFDRFIKKYNNNRTLKLLLYNSHCELSMLKTGGSKSLNMLWNQWMIPGFNETNTFIIDDLKEVHTIQPDNCIRIKPFKIKTGIQDTELLDILKLLQEKNKSII